MVQPQSASIRITIIFAVSLGLMESSMSLGWSLHPVSDGDVAKATDGSGGRVNMGLGEGVCLLEKSIKDGKLVAVSVWRK